MRLADAASGSQYAIPGFSPAISTLNPSEIRERRNLGLLLAIKPGRLSRLLDSVSLALYTAGIVNFSLEDEAS